MNVPRTALCFHGTPHLIGHDDNHDAHDFGHARAAAPAAIRVLTLAPPHPKARRTPMQPSKSASVTGTRFWASISRLVKSMGSWYATTTLTMEFKFQIPRVERKPLSAHCCPIFHERIREPPEGAARHARACVTALSDIGEDKGRADRRETQRYLMNTIMVIVPAAADINSGTKDGKL
ncbi:hypothetical protein A0H81_10649 [Grifola frondosa]|uniref:Uncharacterized protein n=1 Tax=Grifola frondosa TaxID=5627 RepID=A0A1C7LXL4_GRIFR|nr:hypothetical protein A0H81_10649 [Grifola frondosa]